jgi:hypothetical protein
MRDLRGAYLKLRPGEKVSEYIRREDAASFDMTVAKGRAAPCQGRADDR